MPEPGEKPLSLAEPETKEEPKPEDPGVALVKTALGIKPGATSPVVEANDEAVSLTIEHTEPYSRTPAAELNPYEAWATTLETLHQVMAKYEDKRPLKLVMVHDKKELVSITLTKEQYDGWAGDDIISAANKKANEQFLRDSRAGDDANEAEANQRGLQTEGFRAAVETLPKGTTEISDSML